MTMGFRRYVANNARDAMDKVRKELGTGAVILSNRRIDAGRMEIIAAAPEEMDALVEDLHPVAGMARNAPGGATAVATAPAIAAPRRTAPESFSDFIRRQSRPHPPSGDEALAMYTEVASSSPSALRATEDRSPARVRIAKAAPASATRSAKGDPAAVFRRRPTRIASLPIAGMPASARSAPGAREPSLRVPAADFAHGQGLDTEARSAKADQHAVMEELQSLRSTLTDRLTHLESNLGHAAGTGRSPAHPGRPASARAAITRMLMSGFSPELARRVGALAPPDLDPADAPRWLQTVLAQNISCPPEATNPIFAPGAIALVGPTGVGKTTTIAKLAARWVVRHGAAGLGLVTLDSYRMGAHEQLRSYGRILGVTVHSAQDASTLSELLDSLREKRLVLVDTCGMSQRDARLGDALAMLGGARFRGEPVRRVLLLNAASHAETLDEVARAWQIGANCGAIVTKIDEAARIGGALDCLIRYKSPLLGLTNGQRVPEDWHAGNAPLLAHLALKPFGAAFCLEPGDVTAISASSATGAAHA